MPEKTAFRAIRNQKYIHPKNTDECFMKMQFLPLFLAGTTAIFTLSGCSSIINSHRQKAPMMEEYLAGNNQKVLERINDKLESTKDTGDEVMWQLEAGAMYFHTGDFEKSRNHFRTAENLITEYDDRAIISMRDAASEGAMAVTNLNALPYRGFCRDRILLAVYQSLNYLGAGKEDSFRAQIRRLRDEQKKIMEDYQKFFEEEQKSFRAIEQKQKSQATSASTSTQTGSTVTEGETTPVSTEDPGAESTKTDANGNTLSAPAEESNPQEEAKKEQSLIEQNAQNKEFKESIEEMKRVANRGYGNFLNPLAIFLSGLGSVRDDNFENARIDFRRLYEAMPGNSMIQRYYVTVLKDANREIPENLKNVPPFEFPLGRNCVFVIFANGRSAAFRQIAIYFPIMVAWPVCEYYPAPWKTLQVTAGGKQYDTAIIADMDGILSQEYDQRLPAMITRIILSTAIKEGGSYAATIAVARQNVIAGGAVYLGSVIYRATFNTADTRSWEILPKEFQLTQFPMPADHKITIAPDGRNPRTIELPANSRSAIVYVNAPSDKVLSYQVFGINSK